MFGQLVNEKAGTKHLAIFVQETHDGSRCTLYVFYPEFSVAKFVPRIPYGADNAFVDDDGKHGEYFQVGIDENEIEEDTY